MPWSVAVENEPVNDVEKLPRGALNATTPVESVKTPRKSFNATVGAEANVRDVTVA